MLHAAPGELVALAGLTRVRERGCNTGQNDKVSLPGSAIIIETHSGLPLAEEYVNTGSGFRTGCAARLDILSDFF